MPDTPIHSPWALALGTLALALGAASSAAQVSVLSHPNQFTPSAKLATFEFISAPVTGVYAPLGLSFLLSNGAGAGLLADSAPRTFGPGGNTALTNAGNAGASLLMDFSSPMNRVAFEIRNAAADDLVLTLSCLQEAVVVDSRSFSTGLAYTYVAEESAVGFDQVRVEISGGGGGVFLLDNLRFEAYPDCSGPSLSEGFEDGNLADWATLGSTAVLTSSYGTAPSGGRYHALVTTGGLPATAAQVESFLGMPAGHLDSFVNTFTVEGAAIARTLWVEAGDTLHFRWNFVTSELTPAVFSNDFAFVTLSTGSATLLSSTSSPVFRPSVTPFAEETGYQTFNYVFPTSGEVQLGFGVINATDGNRQSALLLDCVLSDAATQMNRPPECLADLTAAELDFLEVAPGAFVVTEGHTIEVPFSASDPDADPLTLTAVGLPATASLAPGSGAVTDATVFSWTPSSADKSLTPLSLEVSFTDPSGAACSKTVTIEDINLDPVCDAGGGASGLLEVECSGPDGALVTLQGTAADPDDGDLMYLWVVSDLDVVLDDPTQAAPTGQFPIGVTMATLTVTDGRGGLDTSDVSIVVQDTTPPEVSCTTDLVALWPPDHALRPVTVVVEARDVCLAPDAVQPIVVSVRSSEPDDAPDRGDGTTSGDVHGQDGFGAGADVTAHLVADPLVPGRYAGTLDLRAERQGTGSGRTYFIDVTATDSHGNSATTSCVVIVPHDRRRK